MKIACVQILLLIHSVSLLAGQDTIRVRDPLQALLESFAQASSDLDSERAVLKIDYDFNSDSIPDLAVSNWPNLCGNAGCEWTLYLGQPSGDYVFVDGLFFNDGGICIQRLAKGVSRIYTYTHYSADEGSLEEYVLASDGATLVSSVAADTSNWNKFLVLCGGNPSPMIVFSCNVLQFLTSHQPAWKRWGCY